jgi:hypothetical protein
MLQSADRFKTEYSFGLIQPAAEEVRTDTSFFFDNRHRPDDRFFLEEVAFTSSVPSGG